MSIDILTLAMSRKFIKDTVNGLGAIKGAPCEISGIEETEEASVVTFRWTGADGTEQTQTMTIPHGMTDAEQVAIEERLAEVEALAKQALEKAEDGCDCTGGSVSAKHDGQGNVTMTITGLALTNDGQGNIGIG